MIHLNLNNEKTKEVIITLEIIELSDEKLGFLFLGMHYYSLNQRII